TTLGGTTLSYYQDLPPGGTIVLLAIGVFVALSLLAAPLARRQARAKAAADPAGCPLEAGTDVRSEEPVADVGGGPGTAAPGTMTSQQT
ncbi:metal ABC transporter permease, partial [Streptomyces sp. SID11233]|nr:metal ABC transporter permease [Streptomyces sp. SID11233]